MGMQSQWAGKDLAGVPEYKCLPNKQVKEEVWQLFIWVLVQYTIRGTCIKHVRHVCWRQILPTVEDCTHLGYDTPSMCKWTPRFWGSAVSSPSRTSTTYQPLKCCNPIVHWHSVTSQKNRTLCHPTLKTPKLLFSTVTQTFSLVKSCSIAFGFLPHLPHLNSVNSVFFHYTIETNA